jgi:hypothetical protein
MSAPTCSKASTVYCTQVDCTSKIDGKTCHGHLTADCKEPPRWQFDGDGGHLHQYACNHHKVDFMREYPNTVMTPYFPQLDRRRAS